MRKIIDLRVYANRNAAEYFALSVPALFLQVFLILAILKTPALSVSQGIPADITFALQYLVWLIIVFSLFAVVTFRSSLHLTLLVTSYFVAAILSGGATLAVGRYLLSSGETTAFVVAASFCCLMGFGFARAARIEKNRAAVTSKGPLPQQAIAVFLDLFFPLVVALGLVIATVLVVGALRNETLAFPAPLSTIFSDFVVSPIITLVIAALTLVLVKDLVEPWVLYYTINREDAVKIFRDEATKMQARKGLLARLASGGLLFSIVVVVILLAVIIFVFGSSALFANLGPVFGIGKPSPEPSFLIKVNNTYIQFEKLLNTIIRLLWG